MSDRDSAYRELFDPTTPAARLAEIVAAHREFGAEAVVHPNAYPGLREWIARKGDDRARDALASLSAPAPPSASTSYLAAVSPHAAATPATAAPSATAPSDAAGAASSTRRLPRAALVGLVVAGLVVTGGIASAAILLPRVLPAGSPTEAAQRLLASSSALDLVGVISTAAPSEVALLQAPLEELPSLEVGGDGDTGRSAQQAFDRLRNALRVTTTDAEFTTESIAEGVERVTMVGGTITIDGNEVEVEEALWELYESQVRAQVETWASPSDVDRYLQDARDALGGSIDLPHRIDAAQVLRDDWLGRGIAVVTVQEGGGWYVSPLLSAADPMAFASAGGRPSLGWTVPEPRFASSPAAAVEATVDAALDSRAGSSYFTNLAATLPLPERRLLALYGPAVARTEDPWQYGYTFVDVLNIQFDEVTPLGATAMLSGASADLRWDGDSSGSVRIDGTCWEAQSSYSGSSGRACLSDIYDLEELGIADPTLIAEQGAGGWQFSAVRSIAHLSSIASQNFVRLSESGRLDELIVGR